MGREGSVEARRAWLREWCKALWAQMGMGEETPGVPAEVDTHMEELLGLGEEYFKVNENEALLEEDGQESDPLG